jgi:hypothetical protein
MRPPGQKKPGSFPGYYLTCDRYFVPQAAASTRQAKLGEYLVHQAPVGQATLEQVGADEQREPQPVHAMEHRACRYAQGERQNYKESSDGVTYTCDVHENSHSRVDEQLRKTPSSCGHGNRNSSRRTPKLANEALLRSSCHFVTLSPSATAVSAVLIPPGALMILVKPCAPAILVSGECSAMR